jgi:hypothetical protein
MNCTRMIPRASCLLALFVLLALPALGQTTIQKGVDLLETSQTGGTQVDFSFTPIPAGFFCPGSPAFTGKVDLKGVPLTTAPAGVAGNSDTIIERLADAVIPAGGSATIPVVVRALSLTSVNNIQVFCPDVGGFTDWRVDTCLCACDSGSLQPITNLTLTLNQACGCGVANGSLKLNVCLRFTNVATGQTVGPISQIITLEVKDLPWCPNPGNGDLVLSSPFGVDTNCDRRPDLQLTGTSNFHPGRSCATQALDCWTQFASLTRCHKNFTNPNAHPHCVNPVCGKRQ